MFIAHGVSRGKRSCLQSYSPGRGERSPVLIIFRPYRGCEMFAMLVFPRLTPWATIYRPFQGLSFLLLLLHFPQQQMFKISVVCGKACDCISG